MNIAVNLDEDILQDVVRVSFGWNVTDRTVNLRFRFVLSACFQAFYSYRRRFGKKDAKLGLDFKAA